MSDNTHTVFPAIAEATIGGDLIQTANARDLHQSLKVDTKFATWIARRIKEYGFVRDVDFVVDFPNLGNQTGRGGDRKTKEFHLTLDMAKELAMVENNEQGRQVRRYFIQCERAMKSLPADALAKIMRTDGVSRMVAGKVTAIQRWTESVPAVAGLDLGGTVSAYEMIEMAGVPAKERQRGTSQLVTRAMIGFCAERQVLCQRVPAALNPSRPFRFPYPIATEWMLGVERGMERIRGQVDRQKAKKAAIGRKTGQGSLRLVEDRPA